MQRPRGLRGWCLAVGLQVLLLGGAALLYFGVRGLTEGREVAAFDNAEQLLRFESRVWIDVEQSAQNWLLGHYNIVTLANWVYIWGHWPVVIVTLGWLFVRHRSDYLLLRNAMFISGALGLLIYLSYPVAPPRLLPDFIDTVTERSNSYRVLQPPGLVNKYAAMPSLHFGWNLLVGVVIYQVARTRLAELYSIVGPILMAIAVVVTANHFIIDAVVGGAVALVGYMLARRIAVGGSADQLSTEEASDKCSLCSSVVLRFESKLSNRRSERCQLRRQLSYSATIGKAGSSLVGGLRRISAPRTPRRLCNTRPRRHSPTYF